MSDNQQTIPASPVDSATPASDQSLSKVSSDNRPDSSVSADSSITSADSVVVPPPIQSAENLTQSPISTPSANPVSDAIRPDSIDSADSSQVPADLIQQSTDSSIPPITPAEPVSAVSADLPAGLPAETLVQEGASAKVEEELKVDLPPATVSPTEPPVEEVATPVPAETSIPDLSPPLSAPTVSPDLSNPTDLNLSAGEAGIPPPINVGLPNNDGSQVQSGPSDNASTIDTSQSENQSAEIKPEPLGSPAMSSTEPEITPSPPTSTSFGDILSVNSPPAPSPSPDLSSLSSPRDLLSGNSPPLNSPPQPSITNDQPKTVSFGDLLKDSLKVEPTINIEPIEPPIPSVPITSLPSNPPALPKLDVSGEGGQPTIQNPQPISSPSPILDVKDKLVLLREQAKQKKAQKKQATIQKIIDLTKTNGKINNQEGQKILHLPQSTLTDYFSELVSKGIFKKAGKGKATYYHL